MLQKISKKQPSIPRLRAPEDADLTTIMKDYYPKFKVESTSNPDAIKYSGSFDDFYKSSFVSPELAEEALVASQAARRRNKDLKGIPTDKRVHMNTFFPPTTPAADYLKKMTAPSNISMLGWNGIFDFTKDYKKPNFFQRILNASSNNYNFRGFTDKRERQAAMNGTLIGPNVDTFSGLGIVPKNKNYVGFKNPVTKQLLGRSNNLLSANAHEMQHLGSSGPDVSDPVKPGMLTLFPETSRKHYGLITPERTRTYHSMKAMASDLAGHLVTKYDDAVNILMKNGILTFPKTYEKVPPYIKQKMGISPTVNYPQYYKLVRSGKIQPTDPSMIDDVIDINTQILNVHTFKSPMMDLYRKHGIHPYSKQKLGDLINEEDVGFEARQNSKLWKMIRDIEFEEANNNSKGKPFTNMQYA